MTTTTITTIILLLAIGIQRLCSGQQINGTRLINSCCDLGYGRFTFSRKTRQSGVYVIPKVCRDDHLEAEAYCDTINGGGGWLVVQRRQDGSVDFNRNWVEYEDGFGKLTSEFWYGLRALHCLTSQGGWEMRMDLKHKDGSSTFVHYEQFKVLSAKDKYKLTFGGFHGNTWDQIAYHNDMYFTTKDDDNDKWGRNCAIDLFGPTSPAGGWWYNSCHNIMPNRYYSILEYSSTEIKIRPVNCNI